MSTLSRRDVVKLVGGGVVVAAAQGCGMPSAALTAWSAPDDARDPRRRALAHALLAPSAHNRQSWIADLRAQGRVDLYVDTTRLLPRTDPPGRQITISQGTFLELLVMSLKELGIGSKVTLFPDGEYEDLPDDRCVARVELVRASDGRDALFDQVRRRRTSRLAFDTDRPVSAPVLAELLATRIEPGISVHGTTAGPLRQDLRDNAQRAFELETLTPARWRETVELMRVGASEIDEHRDGIAVTGFFPALGKLFGATTVEAMMKPDGLAAKTALEMGRTTAQTAMGWIWLSTDGNSRAEQVAAGRAYVRLHLAATALGLSWQPMSQALQEYPEMAALRRRVYELLGAGDRTVQMLARVGYGPSVDASPRRRLEGIVRST